MSELENGFRLSDLLGLLRRRFTILAAAGVLGLVAGAFAFATSPPKYSATARVQVQPLTTDPFADQTPDTQIIDVATEQDLVKSDAVATMVRKKLNLDLEIRALLKKVTVSSKEDSLVLEITFESGTAKGAQDGANAFADAYLEERTNDAQRINKKNLELIDAQIAFTRKSLDDARTSGDDRAIQDFQSTLNELNRIRLTYASTSPDSVGRVVRRAPLPNAVLSKMALGKGVGVFGLFLIAGLGVALLVDRSDSLGGGRRIVAKLLPEANIRLLPQATNAKASHSEIDAAIDRLAIELSAGGAHGKATSVLLVGTRREPPVALAEELASSLSYAGIPALFVLAGSTERELPQARVVASFTDLLEGTSLSGPPALPEVADQPPEASSPPMLTWLRPRGSAEASGLLRQAVVSALVSRASVEGFELVLFVAATPTRSATAAAIGQWVEKTAVIVLDDDSHAVEQTVGSLSEAGARVTEVVWT